MRSRGRRLSNATRRPLRAKLIFNAASGRPEESPQQLATILSEMQDQSILPEVYTVRPDSRLPVIVRGAIQKGIKLIVVAGGDGTIDNVVGAMVGRDATLGIIPTGTRNNVAFNLGIGEDIAESVALLRRGRRLKIDVGRVSCGHSRHWVLEAAALGLLSDLYPMSDNLQHGDLLQVGGLLSTLVAAAPSKMRLRIDGHTHLTTATHMMLVTNMAFVGPRFCISSDISFRDGRFDVFAFPDMSKLSLLSHVVLSRGSFAEDAGIQHYRARRVSIAANPRMSVLADGNVLGEGSLSVQVHPRALGVIAGERLTG